MIIPKLIIHGGAGSLEGEVSKEIDLRNSLNIICRKTYDKLKETDALSAVIFGICELENDPLFNAGTGSRVQQDGQIRMSASIMDASTNTFSGVINIQNVKNPILVADKLQSEKHTVIAGDQATTFAHDKGFKKYDPLVKIRWEEHLRSVKGKTGTVGVVALDARGNIVAGTSTGGIGGEIPGRVSDTPTVSGNFANKFAGISATGIGEQIVNSGATLKIVTRVEDGLKLKDAVHKSIKEAKSLDYEFGIISIAYDGEICVDKTTDSIFYACHDGKAINSF